MPAQTLNLKKDFRIEQGSDFGIEFIVVDENGDLYSLAGLTDNACAGKIRETKDSTASVSFVSDINTTTSKITLTLSAAVTAGFTYYSGYWDCELTELDGTVTRLLEGTVTISQEVTKP